MDVVQHFLSESDLHEVTSNLKDLLREAATTNASDAEVAICVAYNIKQGKKEADALKSAGVDKATWKKIKANKRLFLTATPKVFTNQTKGQAKSRDIELVSMDDRSFFGDILYNLKFSDAINNKPALLTDYKLIVIGVDDEMIYEEIENRNLASLNDGTIIDSELLASHIALAKAIKTYDLSSVITFHSRVESAKFFAEVYPKVANLVSFKESSKRIVNCDYVHGNMSTYQRKNKLIILNSSNK